MIPCHSWNLEKAFWIFNNIKQTTYLDLCGHLKFLFPKKFISKMYCCMYILIHTCTYKYDSVYLYFGLLQIPQGLFFCFTYVLLLNTASQHSFKLSISIFMNDIWISNVCHEFFFSEVSSIYLKLAYSNCNIKHDESIW